MTENSAGIPEQPNLIDLKSFHEITYDPTATMDEFTDNAKILRSLTFLHRPHIKFASSNQLRWTLGERNDPSATLHSFRIDSPDSKHYGSKVKAL
jgi:hypothetical protein